MNRTIRILTDSGCDLTAEDARAAGVDILPFPITADGITYLQGTDFTTAEEFYAILERSREVPKHAQITPMRYMGELRRFEAEGCVDAVVITIASAASSTWQSAVAARDTFYEERPGSAMRVHVVDSRCFSAAYGYAAWRAARMAAGGAAVEEILAFLKDWFASMEIYAAPYSLEYARRSGRIGAAASIVGGALGVRPLLRIVDGKASVCGKVRGNAAVAPALCDIALGRMRKGSPYGMLYGTFGQAHEVLRRRMEDAVGYGPFGVYRAGPVIAVNIGPKMLGIGFLSDRP